MAPRSDETNAQIRDQRREQILLAALKLFTRRGFTATKISDIADEAQISRGLMYHYFKSKDDVYIELVRIAVTGAGDSLKQVESLDMPPVDKLRAIASLILASIAQTEESGYLFVLMAQAAMSDANPQPALELFQRTSEPVDVLCRIVRTGQELGCIRPGDPLEMVLTFLAAIQGLALYQTTGYLHKLPDAEILLRLFLPDYSTEKEAPS